MDLKNEFKKETSALLDVKKPYETAAFVIFGVFLIQQFFYIFISIVNYFDNLDLAGVKISDKIVFFRFGGAPNIPAFVTRILAVNPASAFYIFLTFLFIGLWYALIFVFVWNYCRKHNLAKWTWTAIIAFGPATLFFIPTYLIFAIYVFRPYVFRFIRKGVDEYHKYNEKYEFEEEKEK